MLFFQRYQILHMDKIINFYKRKDFYEYAFEKKKMSGYLKRAFSE